MVVARDRSLQPIGASRVLSSPLLNTALGLVGLVVPLIAWAAGRSLVKDLLLILETLVLAGMWAYVIWIRSAYIQLRRANAKSMSDARYFEAIRKELESALISDFDEIADGKMHVYATEVPRISVMLYRVLLETGCEPRRVLATDLTTDPRILGQRREYLAVNRRFIDSGGIIKRAFICRHADLLRRAFAVDLLELISQHRSMGVQCGLVVREWLRPDEAVDFVVVGMAAVLIEEEQGDEKYGVGRSSVSFKYAAKWAVRFESVWAPEGSYSAPIRLARYEAAVRAMLDAGTWRPSTARASLEFQPQEA